MRIKHLQGWFQSVIEISKAAEDDLDFLTLTAEAGVCDDPPAQVPWVTLLVSKQIEVLSSLPGIRFPTGSQTAGRSVSTMKRKIEEVDPISETDFTDSDESEVEVVDGNCDLNKGGDDVMDVDTDFHAAPEEIPKVKKVVARTTTKVRIYCNSIPF